ncbi:GAF and ANTAR domain-containing protein [Rhodococcus sp. G-MC3]|uniref:GAF and ANTAR domain-containing protein n=1 Tax=Rhodococcus sp. G-MC3 TaxID=3046209 RepID=UPI0024B9925B|nr:GAF and ANTAR domain-containing protein [Rhodococcus sp. G-MC3]MDJ0392902.1 GAF and ANTAR domain-containing protein [Rhodococcus sp. G-MC3]
MTAGRVDAATEGTFRDSTAPTVRWGHPAQGADLADALGTRIDNDDELDAALHVLVTLAGKAIDGAAGCGVTVTISDRTFTAVYSDARTLIVDADQYKAGDGPCLHAVRTGEVVRVDSVAADRRWPEFAKSASTENIHSFLAAPLYCASTRFGALNLYGQAPSAFTDGDVETATALTDAFAGALGDYERFDRVRGEASGLRFTMEHRAPIEQAKGILMATHRIDADAAFDMLVDMSQRTNRKLRDLALQFVRDCSATPT